MGAKGWKAARAGLGYTIGNVLVRGISFISMPIFARLLTVADYGIYNTFTSYVNIFALVIGFALHTSIKNANIDYREKINDYSSSVTLVILASSVFWLGIAVVFKTPLAKLLSLEQSYLPVLIVIESLGLSMINFYNSYLAIEYKYKEYLAVSLAFAVLGIGLSIGLILSVFHNSRYLGRIFGTLSAAVLVGIYILVRLYKKAKPKINKEYWKYGLSIGIPLVPHGLSQVLLSQFDRIMIKNIIGSTESGLYSFAYNIMTIYNVIAVSLDTAWAQWFFDHMEQKLYGSIKRIANIYAVLMAAFSVALFLIAPELITILGGLKYEESKYVVFPILLSAFYGFMYYFPVSVEYFYKKTRMIAIATMIAAALNVILNIIFIPRYGYIAAAYTTVFCYLVYYIVHVLFAYRIHKGFLFDMRVHTGLILAVSISAFACLLAVELRWLRLGIFGAALIAVIIFAIMRKDLTKKVFNIFLKR